MVEVKSKSTEEIISGQTRDPKEPVQERGVSYETKEEFEKKRSRKQSDDNFTEVYT